MVPNYIPPEKPKIAFVGEAPAREEERLSTPFVGPAGRELDLWLQGIVIRSRCFVGNLSQERAPGDRLIEMFEDKRRLVPGQELSKWLEVLKEQLEELRPNIVVTLGELPTYIFTRRLGITNLWGSILPSTFIPGMKVMPLPHPSYVIRGKTDIRPVIRHWIRRAVSESEFPEIRRRERVLVFDPSFDEVMEAFDRLEKSDVIACDIETARGARLKREGPYGLVYEVSPMICVGLSDSPDWAISIPLGGRWELEAEAVIWRRLSKLLGKRGVLKVFHNAAFDIAHLCAYGIYVAPPLWDTMISHNRAFLDFTKDKLKDLKLNRLAFCTAFYTNEPFYKDEKGEGDGTAFWIYNAKDAVILHEIMEATEKELEASGGLELFKRDMKVLEVLLSMSLRGIRRDTEKIVKVKEETEKLIKKLQSEVDAEAGHPVNTKSSKQMQVLLYGELNLPVQFNKDTGRPTANEAALTRLARKTKLPILENIKRLNRLRTFRQNYLSKAVSADGRSRTTYSMAATSTTRVSSSTPDIGEGSNLQVIPSARRNGEDDYNHLIKELKKTFLPDDGKLLFRCDYEQAEARVVAWLSEDVQLINGFETGADIHLKTASILWETSYEEAVEGYLNGNPEWGIRRFIGKRVRHASNYKMGPNTLRDVLLMAGLDVEIRQCRQYLQRVYAATPPLVKWHAEVEQKLKSTKMMENCFGRKRRFFGPIDDAAIREALAFNPQSTVADMLNFALASMYEDEELMERADLLLQLHDAVIGQCRPEDLDWCLDRVKMHMRIPLVVKGRELVIPCSAEAGPSWGELRDVSKA